MTKFYPVSQSSYILNTKSQGLYYSASFSYRSYGYFSNPQMSVKVLFTAEKARFSIKTLLFKLYQIEMHTKTQNAKCSYFREFYRTYFIEIAVISIKL